MQADIRESTLVLLEDSDEKIAVGSFVGDNVGLAVICFENQFSGSINAF